MTGEPPDGLPARRPVEDMTPEERAEYARELGRATRRLLAELNRPKRERKLRRGIAKPRNRAELAIFGTEITGGAGRQLRGSGRRRNLDRAEPFENMPMAEALEAESERGRAKREDEVAE